MVGTAIRASRARLSGVRHERGWRRLARSLASCDLATRRWTVGGEALDARQTLERLLLGNVLPFWFPGVVDEDGGFRLNHDGTGAWRGPAPRQLVSQARTTWFFAAIAGTPYRQGGHLQAALGGFRFLHERFWDAQHGGFFLEVDASGSHVLDTGKHLYAQAFGLYALSAVVQATGDGSALRLADELFRLMDTAGHDPDHGGYHEDLARDWRVRAETSPGLVGAVPGQKTLNTHLHLLEAFEAYHRVSGSEPARRRAAEVWERLASTVRARHPGACGQVFRADWTCAPDDANRRLSYGHDLEMLWIMREHATTLAIPTDALERVAGELFEWAWRYGYDPWDGGFFHRGPYGAAADHREKIWWVQAEALLSSLDHYLATASQPAALCFAGTLDWIVGRQADWVYHEWHASVDRSGWPAGDKAGTHWKSPYHTGRALLKCLERLDANALPIRRA